MLQSWAPGLGGHSQHSVLTQGTLAFIHPPSFPTQPHLVSEPDPRQLVCRVPTPRGCEDAQQGMGAREERLAGICSLYQLRGR